LLAAAALLKSAQARDVFVHELAALRECMDFMLIGYVVMPEHVHLLLSEPPRGTPSTVLHDLKLRTARRLRKARRFEESGEPLHAFWQARFYDFNVFTEKKKKEKLEYMHGNLVSRGLVSPPQDWPWSSWSNYARNGEGLIPVDLFSDGGRKPQDPGSKANLGHPARGSWITGWNRGGARRRIRFRLLR
jgi:putative transposase